MNPLSHWYRGARADWPMVPLRGVAKMGTGHTPDRTKPEYWENCTIPWVTAADLSTRPSEFEPLTDTSQYASPLGVANSSAVVHPAETVMFCRTASVGLLAITERPMATTQAFVTWTAGPRLLPRYLLFVIAAMRPELMSIAYGSTHLTIYMPDLKALEIPLPPLDEQRRIVDFLDDQVARIDQVATLRQQQNRLTRVHRDAFVYATVTGQDKLERSGIGPVWASQIPEDWRNTKVCYVARLGSGHTPSRSRPEWWVDGTVPWITTGEVASLRSDDVEHITTTREKLSLLGIENSSATVHPGGTVVLCRTAASAGYSGVMPAPMCTSQDFATWTCGSSLDPYWLLWCLRAMRSDLLERLAMGSTFKTIYMPDLEGIRIPLPSLVEQSSRVARIRNAVAAAKAQTSLVTQDIKLLRERKQALITAAVTGQFDVSTGRSAA